MDGMERNTQNSAQMPLPCTLSLRVHASGEVPGWLWQVIIGDVGALPRGEVPAGMAEMIVGT